MSEKTTIQIDSDVRDTLRALKKGNETYTDVITRLIDENDFMKFAGGELENDR